MDAKESLQANSVLLVLSTNVVRVAPLPATIISLSCVLSLGSITTNQPMEIGILDIKAAKLIELSQNPALI